MTKRKRKTVSKISEKNFVVKVVNEKFVQVVPATITVGDSSVIKTKSAKTYPPIYTYIYEREPEDMAKIFEEHKNSSDSLKPPKPIKGFKMIDGKLVAIGK